jgi:hypothetical protein
MRDAITPPSAALANMSIRTVAPHTAMDSPNAMALDHDDTHVIQPNGMADKESVTEINPDALNGDTDTQPDLPGANDCTASSNDPSYYPRYSADPGV